MQREWSLAGLGVLRCGIAACACALILLAPVPARADGIHASLFPADTTVLAGDTLRFELDVTEAGVAFNAFRLVIQYDPAALTFVPASPTSNQVGALLKDACASTIQPSFVAAADSLRADVSMMCAGVSVTGPGTIYQLRFVAKDVATLTSVVIRRLEFHYAGPLVGPTYSTDAQVAIGGALGAPLPPRDAAVVVRAAPNPCRAGTVCAIAAPSAGFQQLVVRDVAGRAVRALERGVFAAGTRRVAWDGRDDAGRMVPPGVYSIEFLAAGQHACARVAVVP